jgi:glyoxylase-like metal-dependent hydrolase (beta-lactamase superfamily II)
MTDANFAPNAASTPEGRPPGSERPGDLRTSGTWTITQNPCAPIHTFTAPEDGWLVTSHIIELPSELLVVDAQYTLPCARQVVRRAAELKKPVTRLYVTHYHPDHLLGAEAFDAPLFALDSVSEKISTAGDRLAREEHEKVGDDIAAKARQPDRHIHEGEEVIDGVRVEHLRLRGAETDDALIVALPEVGAILVQDLVYNRSHPFLGERHFDSWRAALRRHRDMPYDIVLPGHGLPGGKVLYDEMIEYLDFAEGALKQSAAAPDFRQRLTERYPDHGCGKVLDHQLRFLFR